MTHSWRPGDRLQDWSDVPGRTRLRSVLACERQDWTLVAWPKAADPDPETGELGFDQEPVQGAFCCGSWRCRRCARLRGASDFVRAREAILGRPWWLYCVLTFDPSKWETCWQAYREGGRCWNNSLREALRRAAGRFEYLQTWESTRRGWPHLNLIATGDELRAFVEGLGTMRRTFRSDVTGKERTTTFPRGFRRWLGPRAVAAGFGLRVWAEVLDADNRAGMAGYLLKLSRELTGAAAGPKGEQAPVNAPKGFRRIRASQKLLPPSKLTARGGDWTGRLLPIRTATVDHGPREPGQARRFEASSWSRVFAALRKETLDQVERWPDFFEPGNQSAQPIEHAAVDSPE